MTFELLGQGQAFARALRQARSRTLPHALALVGARGTGKSTAARVLAAALLCEAPPSEHSLAACGSCPACKKVAAEVHPDLLRVEVPEDKREIPVEQVRELLAALTLCTSEGRGRVAILDPGDALNEQGQNALLKTLEEPGQNTWLLIPTTRPESLLVTVRSRVQRLGILPLPEATVRTQLTAGHDSGAEHSAENRELCARVAGGSLGLARELLASEIATLVPLVEGALDQTLGGETQSTPPALAKALLAGVTGKSEVERRARQVLVLMRARQREVARRTLASALAEAGGSSYVPALDRWIAVCDALCDAEDDLQQSIPVELALAGALLRIRSAAAG